MPPVIVHGMLGAQVSADYLGADAFGNHPPGDTCQRGSRATRGVTDAIRPKSADSVDDDDMQRPKCPVASIRFSSQDRARPIQILEIVHGTL